MPELRLPPQGRRLRARLRRRAAIAGGLTAALLTGLAGPATAAEPPVALPEAHLTKVLFASAIRVKDSGIAYHKNAVASAELLDWRAKNPTADATAVGAHLTKVRTALNAGLKPVDAERSTAELLRRLMQNAYAASPDAVITGPRMTALLGVVSGRDLGHVLLSKAQRLTGAQQGLDLDAAYTKAAAETWTAVHEKAKADAAFAGAWRTQLGAAAAGQPFAVDPTATSAVFKALPQIKAQVDVDALVSKAAAGKTAFYAEAHRQFTLLQGRYQSFSTTLHQAMQTAKDTTPIPGSNTTPQDPAKTAQAKAAGEAWQKKIDEIKGGLDFVVGALKHLDAGFGNKVAQWVETAYKVATTTITLVTAISTLATSTSIGFATFSYVGAAIGAIVGLVQIFAGLFGGSSGADQAAQQQILNAINSGFSQLNANLKQVHDSMHSRFDRIDAGLNQIYAEMQVKFAEVIELIKNVNSNVRQVHEQVLSLQSKVMSFNKVLLDAIGNPERNEFIAKVGQYVDWPFYNNGAPMPSYNDHYVPAVSRFLTTANDTARSSSFVHTDLAQTDPQVALAAKGPAGAIDWLANHANRTWGTNFGVSQYPANVPNADLWAEAARAYYLTALQNPRFAGQEGPAQNRITEIIDNGKLIRDRAKQFHTPGGVQSNINKLFQGLNSHYLQALRTFSTGVKYLETRPEVMRDGRHFPLWADHNQPVAPHDVDKLQRPAETGGACSGTGSIGAFPTPAIIDGKQLPAPLMAGRWIEPAWQFNACMNSNRWLQGVKQKIGSREVGGVMYFRYRINAILDVEFHEKVQVPNGPNVLGRITNGTKEYYWCTWEEREDQPRNPPCGLPNANEKISDGQPYKVSRAVNIDGAGTAETTRLLSDRRANFYDAIARETSLDAVAAARPLNNIVRLYQAYTDLGLPRAKETDDQLHALLYGAHGLVANTPGRQVLSAIYAQAARAERDSGGTGPLRVPLLNDTPNGVPTECPRVAQPDRDPVSSCASGIGMMRGDYLNVRMYYLFERLAAGTELQTLPMIDETIANLELARQQARTAYPNG